jgi:hypothetical protein
MRTVAVRLAIIGAIAALGLLFAIWLSPISSEASLTRVGGATNACTCSQRIEP